MRQNNQTQHRMRFRKPMTSIMLYQHTTMWYRKGFGSC